MLNIVTLIILLVLVPISSWAQDVLSDQDLEKLLQIKIRTVETFGFSPTLIEAVRKQNAEGLTLDTIRQRDQEWSASNQLTPFKLALQRNKAGRFLKRHVESNPAIVEAFLTDNQGANVAAYPATSDYWQGDEEKWTAAFNGGEGKTWIGPLEDDESTQTTLVQISAPILNRGETIGVLVMGISLGYIESRQQTAQR